MFCPRNLAGALMISLCCAYEATAQEIPDYDTEAFCERRAGSNTPENRRFATCLSIEEMGLAELEDHWAEADETTRFECIEEASQTGSYVVLASCVMNRLRRQRRR
jgi:hypothetical protein